MSLRGGELRPRKKLPPVLMHAPRRHELPEELANVLLCRVLGSLALQAKARALAGSDPIVEFRCERYRLVGTLVSGGLFDIKTYQRRFRIFASMVQSPDGSAPAVSAIEHVSYVMPERFREPA